jgi:hypothetical protein
VQEWKFPAGKALRRRKDNRFEPVSHNYNAETKV